MAAARAIAAGEVDRAVTPFVGMLPWSRLQTVLAAAVLDADPALAAERDQHWARVGAASFLTDAEKRAALGLPPLGLTARGEG